LALCQKLKIKVTILNSPMFLTSRDEFKTYLGKSKKPFMKSFYEGQRKRLKILINEDGTPVGDKWSFDEDNRKPLPKDFVASELPQFIADDIDKKVFSLVEDNFSKHPGQIDNYWLPTDRKAAKKWLKSFINERLRDFGPYEDAMTEKFDFVNH
jgi:deoxyribodipyrimidine photolyase-related protein